MLLPVVDIYFVRSSPLILSTSLVVVEGLIIDFLSDERSSTFSENLLASFWKLEVELRLASSMLDEEVSVFLEADLVSNLFLTWKLFADFRKF